MKENKNMSASDFEEQRRLEKIEFEKINKWHCDIFDPLIDKTLECLAEKKWFKLKDKNFKWWHWVIRPRYTWLKRKWLKDAENKMADELSKDDRLKKFNKFYAESMIYGTAQMDIEKEFGIRRRKNERD